MAWEKKFKKTPLTPLKKIPEVALQYWVTKDLLDEPMPSPQEALWNLPEVETILNKQLGTGAWRYKNPNILPRLKNGYNQLETYRQLRFLIDMYGLDKNHPAVKKAASFLFSCQTPEGDFRGIYDKQYAPNYSAAYMEMLIKAGYLNHSATKKGFNWLLVMRQEDGGWAIPSRTAGVNMDVIFKKGKPHPTIPPDRTKPSSHLVTGIVLRAFAEHPDYKESPDIKRPADFLKKQLFKRDNYPDRSTPDFWTKFSYPFWQTDLLSALDTLSKLGYRKTDPHISNALDWFVKNQNADGLWPLKLHSGETKYGDAWVTLAVCRVFKRFYG